MDLIRVGGARFWLPDNTIQEGNEAGEVFSGTRGPRLWQAEFTLAPGHHADVDREEARLALLTTPGASFFCYDPRRNGPHYDPGGDILGGATPEISTVAAREISIDGLPTDYRIRSGDYIGFAYGTSPVRYALHRAMEDRTAGLGIIGNLEVQPRIRDGLTVGTPVQLVRPVIKMKVIPGSVSYGAGSGLISGGATFRATQTLR